MASLWVLAFDHEGRPVQFDTWLDDLQLYLLSDSKDSVSLFDQASGAATAPPATADTQALYDAVVASYSSPATAALGRLLLPYLFPELSAFATVKDLVSHLRASDARYRAGVPADFLERNPPPMYITIYFKVIRLPDSLRSIRDHFLSLDPTSLTVDLLEQHLLTVETSAVAVGAARGTPRPPFFEGCSPSPLAPSYASAAAADVYVLEDFGAASASAKRRNSKGKGGRGGAPPATADVSTRSQWLSRDATARLAICNHLPASECAHFGEHRTAQALYDVVVARYSSPATAAIGRLLLPYLFPELSAFATIADLVTHLRTSDARYRATVSAEDHFLTLDPTSLTVDLLEQHLLAAETSAVAVGAARGTPRSPFYEGCSPSPLSSSFCPISALRTSVLLQLVRSAATARARVAAVVEEAAVVVEVAVGVVVGAAVEEAEAVEVVAAVEPVAEVEALVAEVEAAEGVAAVEAVGPVVVGLDLTMEALVVVGASSSSVGVRLRRPCSSVSGRTCGRFHTERRCFACLDDAWHTEFGDDVECPRWAELLRSGVAIFDLDFDVIISAMYALSFSAEGDCYWCVPPNPGIAAAALGARATGTPPGTTPAKALHTFMLDSGASRCFFRDSSTLTPLPAPVPVRLADPSGGPVVASSSTVLPCPVVPSDSLSRLHLPSFSTNLVSTAALQDAMVTTTTPRGQRVSICTCTRTGRHLATFTRRPGSSLYTLATEPPHVAASAQVSASLAALTCLPCVEGRQRAAPHSSSFPPTAAPLQTLDMDVWGPARVSGQGRERYFLLVVDDCTRYTIRLQLRERFGQDPPVLRLHSDRGGEFSSVLLRDFCRGEGITQSFTLPDSPQQNGIAERRIGLVMEVARTSMIHAAAPHFLWPFAGSRAFVRDTSADKLSACAIPCVFLGFVPDAPGWQYYYPTSRRVLPSQDVTFDESVPFYRLFPYRSAPSPPPPPFLALDPPPVYPLPPKGPAPSEVSQVDPLPGTAPVQVAVIPGAALGAASRGAASGGAEPGGAGSEGVGSGGAEPEGVEPGGAESEGAEPGGGKSEGAESGGAEPRGAALSRDTKAGGAAVTPGAGDPTEPGAAGAGGAGAGVAGVEGPGTGGAGAIGAGAVDPGAGGAGGTVRPRPYFVPLLQQVLGVPSSTGLPPPFLCPPPDQSQPASPLPVPSPYTEQSGGLTERREPVSRSVLPVCTAPRAPRSRPPRVPGTHTMALPRAASPTFARLVATTVTDPSFESAAASALIAELLDFAVACRIDYASALVAESVPASPPSVRGECALGTDVLEDRQEDFECLASAVPRFASLLLAPEGDSDAPDIPTPRSYAEAITGPYSSQWQAAMDAEMASWKSTGTYVDEVPPPGVNIVDGMWIFRVKRLPGSPSAFKARYVARGFSHLRRPVYGLRQAPREWHDTLTTTLAALGFVPSTADRSLFLRTDTSLPPFYDLMYVDDLVFATPDTEALTLVKSELQKRHTCTDLGELRSYLGLQITWDRARRTITLTQSHMVDQVLQRFGYQFSSPQPTPLSTSHSLSAPPSDESVEPSGQYPELVGCLMYLMTCTRPDLA
ncbi:unnamed protein product [Closterium sp. NIES-54]